MHVRVTFTCFLTLSCQHTDRLNHSEIWQCGMEKEGNKQGQGS